ncbi:hypothetical protein Hanom_Chr07g00607581 [Helianthus anomalus]
MASYQEGLKGSVVISILQARLKVAYETRATGLEFPSWNVEAWEAKLRDLGGDPVKPPVKTAVEEPTKAANADAVKDAGGDADGDAGGDAGENTVEVVIEEGGAA